MENVGIFYDLMEYFTAICYNLWQFGIVGGHLIYFFPIWYAWSKQNMATLIGPTVGTRDFNPRIGTL
jgi:hypothetical protein